MIVSPNRWLPPKGWMKSTFASYCGCTRSERRKSGADGHEIEIVWACPWRVFFAAVFLRGCLSNDPNTKRRKLVWRPRINPDSECAKKLGDQTGLNPLVALRLRRFIIATWSRSEEERTELVYRRSSLQNSLVVADLAMGVFESQLSTTFQQRHGSDGQKAHRRRFGN
jgi:hypothetical protein